MSDLLQPGQHAVQHPDPHPDADQISAFLDRALPPHERSQLLAHLAVCRDCREAVALSLPPAEAPQQPVAEPARRPWFSGWNVFLPAAVALAALALFAVFVHRAPLTRSPESNQTAQVQPLPAQVVASQPAAKPSVSAPTPQAAPTEQKKLSPGEPGVAGSLNAEPTISAKTLRTIPAQNQRIGSFAGSSQQLRAANSPQDAIQGSMHGTAFNGGTGSGFNSGTSAKQILVSPAPAFAEYPPPGTGSGTAEARFNQPVLEAPAAAPAIRSAQTVTVESGAVPLETTSADLANMNLATSEVQAGTFVHPLPSRLQVLSKASNGRLVLAIDSRNTVFLSGDSGRRWKVVPVQWQGRAVKAEVVTPMDAPRAPLEGFVGGQIETSAGSAPTLDKSMNASLTGTVTDMTGAAIPGATVVIYDQAAHAARKLKTRADGSYRAAGLPAGSYTLRVQASGFQTRNLSGVVVTDSLPAVANLTLDVGAATETVTVEAAPTAAISSNRVRATRLAPVAALPAVFEITTDTGDRWTSSDGLTWQRR